MQNFMGVDAYLQYLVSWPFFSGPDRSDILVIALTKKGPPCRLCSTYLVFTILCKSKKQHAENKTRIQVKNKGAVLFSIVPPKRPPNKSAHQQYQNAQRKSKRELKVFPPPPQTSLVNGKCFPPSCDNLNFLSSP